jgi:hypothetical protein
LSSVPGPAAAVQHSKGLEFLGFWVLLGFFKGFLAFLEEVFLKTLKPLRKPKTKLNNPTTPFE